MPSLFPFKALRPTPHDAARVASLPYDVVDYKEAKKLSEGNAASFMRVERSDIDFSEDHNPYDDTVYAKARENLYAYLTEGVFLREDAPAYYLYRQIMQGRAQYGLVACVHADDYFNDKIKKHELTREDKEKDRIRHVLAINANDGPIFLAYKDQGEWEKVLKISEKCEVIFDFTSVDGVRHTGWKIPEAADQAEITRLLSAKDAFYIADGHHRTAAGAKSSLERKKQNPLHNGSEEYNRILAVIFPDHQLKILPYHRIVKDLNGHTPAQLISTLEKYGTLKKLSGAELPAITHSFTLYLQGAWYLWTLNPAQYEGKNEVDSLDVSLLQQLVLSPVLGIENPRTDKRIDFVGGIRGLDYLQAKVDEGGFALAVAMYPTSMDELMDIADAGKIMPPKSTWFEPKLRSGLWVHELD